MQSEEEVRREQSLKKSILWNALQPGDPYDIRKSMIASLPGGKKVNMGGKLEMVCLLQAAEIQRLSVSLQDYRVKLRQQETVDLDRHSYEMQIKELAGKLQGEGSLKAEIAKLRNFIDRLNKEYEDKQHEYSTGNTQLSEKYQQALQQVFALGQENNRLKEEMGGLKVEVESGEEKIEDYENKFSVLGVEIERLNRVLQTKNEETSEAARQAEQLRGENQGLVSQIGRLEQEKQRAGQEVVDRMKSELNEAKEEMVRVRSESGLTREQVVQSKLQIQQYEQANATLTSELEKVTQERDKLEDNSTVLGQEVERLNAVLRSKVDQVSTLQFNFKTMTEENQFYVRQAANMEQQARELVDNRKKLEEVEFQLGRERQAREQLTELKGVLEPKVEQYEERIVTLSAELERLNALAERKNGEGEQYQQALQRVREELKRAQFECEEARRQQVSTRQLLQQQEASRNSLIVKLNQNSREYEAKIAQLQAQKHSTQQQLAEHHQLQIQCERYQNQIAMVSLEVDRLNGALGQQVSESSNKMLELEDDVERLNNLLRLKVEEAARWEASNSELASRLGSAQVEINSRNAQQQGLLSERRDIQAQITTLTQERQGFMLEIAEYKSKFEQVLGEVQRLQSLLQKSHHDNSELHSQVVELQAQLQQQTSREKSDGQQAEIRRLNELVDSQREEIRRLRLSLTEEGAGRDQKQQQMALIVGLFAEIEALRNRLGQQEEEAIRHHRDSFL